MKFLGDMGVSTRVIEWLRQQEYDAVHVRDLGMGQSLDVRILDEARSQGRVLLTFDLDFSDLLVAWGQQPSPVVVFRLRNPRIPNVIERLQTVLRTSANELEHACIIIVEDARHRVRSLV